MTGTILFVSGDLMFWASVRAAGERAGSSIERAGDETALAAAVARGGIRRVLFDLATPGLDPNVWARRLKALPDPPALVAFGSHVDEEALRAAVEAGFDEVMPRSRFHRTLASLVG